MTAQEIRDSDELFKSERGWLKEIAYQLALLNETKLPQYDQTFRTDVVQLTPVKRGPRRPPKPLMAK